MKRIILEFINAILSQLNQQDTIVEACGDFDFDIEDALATTQLAHLGQYRRSGEPYLQHPLEVAEIVHNFYPGDKVLCAAALMHDTLEDALAQGNVQDNAEMARLIAGSFGDETSGTEVLRIVRALTHDKGSQLYSDYVVGLLDDLPALRIKLADMLHNLRSNPSLTQKKKYAAALRELYLASNSQIPIGISKLHWDSLLLSLKDNN